MPDLLDQIPEEAQIGTVTADGSVHPQFWQPHLAARLRGMSGSALAAPQGASCRPVRTFH